MSIKKTFHKNTGLKNRRVCKSIRKYVCVCLIMQTLFVYAAVPITSVSATTSEKVWYVSPLGNDSNNGLTPVTPFLSFSKCLMSDKSITIFAMRGTYPKQTFTFDGLATGVEVLKIIPYDVDKVASIKQTESTSDKITINNGDELTGLSFNSGLLEKSYAGGKYFSSVFTAGTLKPLYNASYAITAIDNYDNIKPGTVIVTSANHAVSLSGTNVFIVGTNDYNGEEVKAYKIDADHFYFTHTYTDNQTGWFSITPPIGWAGVMQECSDSAKNKRLIPVLAKDKTCTPGTFFWDGTKIYINPYVGGYTKFVCYNGAAALTIKNVNELQLDDFESNYCFNTNLWLENIDSATLNNCSVSYSNAQQGFSFTNTNANVYNSFAYKNGQDGFNIHCFGKVNIIDCSSSYNLDDGASHHDSTTGFIHGGLYSHNGKAGIIPAYGAQVDIFDTVCSNNRVDGIHYASTGTVHADMAGISIGNSLFSNGRFGFVVDPRCTLTVVNNIFADNALGDYKVYGTGNLKQCSIFTQEGSCCVVDYSNGYICGLTAGITCLDAYVDVISGSEMSCLPTQGGFGTGTVVNVTRVGEIDERYTIIIFGDVNGDGTIGAADSDLIYNYENYMVDWDPIAEPYLFEAGDVNGDGNIDCIDADSIINVENYAMNINQVTGIAYV